MTLNDIRSLAARQQLTEVGCCPFAAVAERLLPCRAAARLPARATSVITVLFPYRFPEDDPGRNLSRYACVPDYHGAAGAVLRAFATALSAAFPESRFEPFMDNSPIPEVRVAVLSGLGCRGDNGLLLSDRFGSFVFIGTVVTDASVDAPPGEWRECLHCGACARACPAGAIGDKTRCLSALTQKKGVLTPEEQARIRAGGSVWGCDVCQDVCPQNRGALCAPHPCFSWIHTRLTPEDLDDLSDKAYGWRGAAVPRRNLAILNERER